MYKFVNNKDGSKAQIIFRILDSTWIPFDPANTDFLEYQKWLAEGNTPQPANEEN